MPIMAPQGCLTSASKSINETNGLANSRVFLASPLPFTSAPFHPINPYRLETQQILATHGAQDGIKMYLSTALLTALALAVCSSANVVTMPPKAMTPQQAECPLTRSMPVCGVSLQRRPFNPTRPAN